MNNHFFPEDFFPPVSKDYGLRCSQGLQIASKINVMLLGVVRDAQPALERNLMCLEHMRGFFNSSSVFLFENDSKDNSKEILDNYAKTHYNTIFSSEKLNTNKLSDKSLERRVNMAYVRNKYLEHAKKKYKSGYKLDLIIILDLDIIGGYSYTGLLNSLSYFDQYTCIGSNSIYYQNNQRLYYDTWAYKDIYNKLEEEKNLMIFHRGENPFEVDSSFGGMCLYPSSILKHDIKYEDWACDHVTLNKQLKDLGYQILLNPSQIVLYSDHYYVNISSNTNT
jgi:hypothetical protein